MKEAEVRIVFQNPTKKQLKHLSNAQDELSKAGVTFDSSAELGYKGSILCVDWEFDWSLKGAKVHFVRFVEPLTDK
jgi:hypothetical protein